MRTWLLTVRRNHGGRGLRGGGRDRSGRAGRTGNGVGLSGDRLNGGRGRSEGSGVSSADGAGISRNIRADFSQVVCDVGEGGIKSRDEGLNLIHKRSYFLL